MSADGPFKMWLHRWPDAPAKLVLNRVFGKSAFGMTLEEWREVREAIDAVEAIVAERPNSDSKDTLDVREYVAATRAAA